MSEDKCMFEYGKFKIAARCSRCDHKNERGAECCESCGWMRLEEEPARSWYIVSMGCGAVIERAYEWVSEPRNLPCGYITITEANAAIGCKR